jgi:hypothetical protein
MESLDQVFRLDDFKSYHGIEHTHVDVHICGISDVDA